jgi:5-bromo-4-chloroindolyl phosphate hydrolysis protein
MEKIDPYKHKERYDNWNKEKEIKGINSINKKILLKFINDMSLGLNISKGSKKGVRSFIRLNTLKTRLRFIFSELEKRKIKDIRKVNANQLHSLFEDMRAGVLKTRTGTPYKSVGDYIKVFKTFYHWYQKTSKEKIEDITED